MTVITPVFIAYDPQDRSFVNLLYKLLDHEGIDSIRGVSGNSERAQQSRSLIVVVSQHALDSARVRSQLASFRLRAPDATIIPVLLDTTPPTRVDASLESYSAINMYEDMLAGFVELFARYSRGFLVEGARRVQANRRVGPDRRGDLRRRLRVGLWQQFAHSTGLGKFDTIELMRHTSAKLVAALQVELAKYELYDENKRTVEGRTALQQVLATLEACGETKAIYLIEQLVNQLYKRFEIRGHDRRVNVELRAERLLARNASELRVP